MRSAPQSSPQLSVIEKMLPLETNNLTDEGEWHSLKRALLFAKYGMKKEFEEAISTMPVRLTENKIGKMMKEYSKNGDESVLNEAAQQLTQRNQAEAWLLIERL